MPKAKTCRRSTTNFAAAVVRVRLKGERFRFGFEVGETAFPLLLRFVVRAAMALLRLTVNMRSRPK
jgi:hypothetical protein